MKTKSDENQKESLPMSRSVRRQVAFVSVFLIVVAFFVTMYRMGVVRGSSMEPTYESGQVVLVQRRNGFSPPLKRNDVVLIRHDRDVLIKRVYRLGGEEMTDTFPYTPPMIRLSGLDDYYEQQPAIAPLSSPPPRLFVPKGYLVVLGDNIRNSEDSRVFGPLPARDVLGVVVNSPRPPYETGNAPFRPSLPPTP